MRLFNVRKNLMVLWNQKVEVKTRNICTEIQKHYSLGKKMKGLVFLLINFMLSLTWIDFCLLQKFTWKFIFNWSVSVKSLILCGLIRLNSQIWDKKGKSTYFLLNKKWKLNQRLYKIFEKRTLNVLKHFHSYCGSWVEIS